MVEQTNGVDGAPQEEAAKKPVKKTRQPRKTATKAASPKKRAPRKNLNSQENEAVQTEQVNETPTVETQNQEVQVAQAPVQEQPKAETPEPKQEAKPVMPVQKQETKPENQTARPVQKQEQKPAKQEVRREQPAPKQEQPAPKSEQPQQVQQPRPQQQKQIPPLPNIVINDVMELANAPKAQICLSDQQIQQLTLDEAVRRFQYLEFTLANILDYDIVISDTNIWLELLVGHTSSHSDPRVNARLQFERQLEFISKLMKHRGGRFMMMSETYEEIDRFATAQEPTNYRDADWTDEALCRNVAARLAKRLILSEQRENRLRIECICAESHHGAFADPAIIRRTVELFAQGRKVLLLTNDASVAIRSMGMCDDLQRHNKIDDRTWDEVYAPLRPMVFTMDDLKTLDNYTRQYHFLQMAAGMSWMQDIPKIPVNRDAKPVSSVYGGKQVPQRHALELWQDGFRPGDRHERHSDQQARQKEQQKQKEAEKQRQEEAARQKEEQRRLQSERDKARQQELNRQKEAEKQKQQEAQRQAEMQRQAEAQRQAELKKQQAEAEAKKQEDAKSKAEADARKQADIKKQAEIIARRLEEQRAAEAAQQAAKQQNEAQQAAKQVAKQQVEAQQPEQPDAQQAPAQEEKTAEQPKKRPSRRSNTSRGRAPRAKKAKETPAE